MIRYTLTCADGHSFDSWFQSADAFDRLHAAGRVTCAICGGTDVHKSLMAPNLGTDRRADPPAVPDRAPRPGAPGLTAPASPAEQALAALKRHVEDHSDYVGLRFAQEARDMQAGLTPDRAIHGEARLDEARKLIEDGIPIAPLPFTPKRRTN